MLREAKRGDIRRIVEMLADDEIARSRENLDGDMKSYEAAFAAIQADPNNTLYVWDVGGIATGCVQLTFIPGMSYQGAWIAQVEGVRVDGSLRGQGVGEAMMRAMAEIARKRGCILLQLASNSKRADAIRFYEKLGFVKSHQGMKLKL